MVKLPLAFASKECIIPPGTRYSEEPYFVAKGDAEVDDAQDHDSGEGARTLTHNSLTFQASVYRRWCAPEGS